MSGHPMLDFGEILAPSVLASSSDLPPARVQSHPDAIPGEGKHVVTCLRCKRTRRRKRESKFCCDLCRTRHRHEKQGLIEAGKKDRGMAGAAAKGGEYLKIARAAAREIRERDGDADADRVHLYLEERGTVLPSGGWWGSLFQSDPDRRWEYVRHVTSKHKGSRGRKVMVWR